MAKALSCDIIVDMKPTFGHTALVVPHKYEFNEGSGSPAEGLEVLHAGGGAGVYRSTWNDGEALVFRHLPLTGAEAAEIVHVGTRMTSGTKYGVERALFKSWTGSSKFGPKAQERLSTYHLRLNTNGLNNTIVTNLFCSEFVVLAIQLGLNLNRQHRAWLDLDGQHTLPVTLKTYLERNSTHWKCMGLVKDKSLTIHAL